MAPPSATGQEIRPGLPVAVWLGDRDGMVAPWVDRLVAEIAADPRLDLKALILDSRVGSQPSKAARALLSLDRRLLAARWPNAIALDAKGARMVRIGAPSIAGLSKADVSALCSVGAPIILKLGGGDLPPVKNRPTVWTFNHVADSSGGDAEAWIRAAARAQSGVCVQLETVAENGRDRALIDSALCARSFSLARTLDRAADRGVSLALRALRRLAMGQAAPARAPQPPTRTTETRPIGAFSAAMIAGRVTSDLAAKAANRVGVQLRYRLGLLGPTFALHLGEGNILTADLGDTWRLPTAMNGYHADPFLWSYRGVWHVFYERFDFDTLTGHLCVARLNGDAFEYIGDVLGGSDHLSYPFVFEHEGALFMLPETKARGGLELWRCTEFPLGWEHVRTALEGVAAVDSTIVSHNGSLWLFTNIAVGSAPDHNTELSVFRLDGALLTTLTPHRRNPVVIDASSARGGGRIFQHEGRLVRPCQDNSQTDYGYGLKLMEITALDLDQYEERPLRYIRGSHHVDQSGNTFIFDVRRGVKGFGQRGVLGRREKKLGGPRACQQA